MKTCDDLQPGAGHRLVIFDFDGTLADLPVDWTSLKRALDSYFRDTYHSEITFESLGCGLSLVRSHLGRHALEDAYRIVREHEHLAVPHLRPHRDTLNTLREASARGCSIAIFSNNMSDVIRTCLQRLEVPDVVQLIIGRDAVSRYKPDPEGLDHILDRLRIGKQFAAFVGDSDVDAQAASRAGMRFVPASAHSTLCEVIGLQA